MSELKYVNVGLIDAGDNSRKYFDEARLRELKSSIELHGIRTPLEGIEQADGRVTLIAGERRLRALRMLIEEADAAGRSRDWFPDFMEVPVMIVGADEVESARELNLIENLQREGLTPMEEADGYADLLLRINPATGRKYEVQEIAERLSKEYHHVYRRLRLRQAPEIILEAVAAGKVAVSVGVAVGTIPDAALREKCAKQVLFPDAQTVPLNHAQTVQLISRDYMVRIKAPPFNRESADLVPVVLLAGTGERVKGGSCVDCPHRSGNLKGLESEVKGGEVVAGSDEWVCTSPGCYRDKCAADWRLRKSAKLDEIRAGVEAENNGEGEISKKVEALTARLIVEGERAGRIFGGPAGGVSYDSALRRAGDRPGADLAVNLAAGEEPLTWGELAELAGLPSVLALNPHTGKTETLVEYLAVVEKTKSEARANKGRSVFCREVVKPAAVESGSGGVVEMGAVLDEESGDDLGAGVVTATAWDLDSSVVDEVNQREARRVLAVSRVRSRAVRAEIFEKLQLLSSSDAIYEVDLWAALFRSVVADSGGMSALCDWLKMPTDEALKHVEALCVNSAVSWQAWLVLAVVARGVGASGLNDPRLISLAGVLGLDLEWISKCAEKRADLMLAEAGPADDDSDAGEVIRRDPPAFRCDVCGVELVVPAGSIEEAAKLPVGSMKCVAHHGKWDAQLALVLSDDSGSAPVAEEPAKTPDLRVLLQAEDEVKEATPEVKRLTFDDQVKLRREGAKWEDIIGARPAEGTLAFAKYESLRVKIYKAAKKPGASAVGAKKSKVRAGKKGGA